jgi:hypothetical protein
MLYKKYCNWLQTLIFSRYTPLHEEGRHAQQRGGGSADRRISGFLDTALFRGAATGFSTVAQNLQMGSWGCVSNLLKGLTKTISIEDTGMRQQGSWRIVSVSPDQRPLSICETDVY